MNLYVLKGRIIPENEVFVLKKKKKMVGDLKRKVSWNLRMLVEYWILKVDVICWQVSNMEANQYLLQIQTVIFDII